MASIQQKIVPHLWFDEEAREATEFYVSIFERSRITNINISHDTPSGAVEIVSFELCGQEFMAFSAGPLFKFNEAISFIVKCDTQEEIDYYWDRLTSGGGQEVECGWLKDKYGLSWQIVPRIMGDLLGDSDPVKAARVTQALLKMRKLDISVLQCAFEGGKENCG